MLTILHVLSLSIRSFVDLFYFIYLGFYVAFNTAQVISRLVVGREEETADQRQATTSFPTCGQARDSNSDLRGGR